MAELADGFIALPGGLGTLEELAEVAVVGAARAARKPIGLLGPDGYWDALLGWLDHAVAEGFVAPRTTGRLVAVDADLDRAPRARSTALGAARPGAGRRPGAT